MNSIEIFLNAIDIENEEARQAYIDEQCQSDQQLKQEVLDLLAADAAPASLLDNPLVEFVRRGDSDEQLKANDTSTHAGQDQRIDNFVLHEVIGEGGMGTVYRAEQLEPIRREVALKIVKPGMGSREVIARFESERQTLAIMEHPNIARVLDAGVTSDGLPYFVMELVRGQSITDYCDAHQLSTQSRMQLFSTVCRAIQHAHQKGILHRDIKPSNVLVTENDGQPVVKVIDFGLAKAFQSSADQRSSFTEFGRIMGTLPYMSPEQAGLSPGDLDTRSDVYSLGVLLYELLTGSTPIDRQRLQEEARDLVLKIIREEQPPRPSHRLNSSSHDILSSICVSRQTTPTKLERLLRGDLDWIALKALEKARDRRYSGPAALADDIERFLRNEQIEARPPSLAYQFKKFAQRNPMAIAIALTISSALLVGLLATSLTLRARSQMLATQQFQNAQLLQKQGRWSESLSSLDQAEKYGWQDQEALAMGRLNAHFALNDLKSADEDVEVMHSLQTTTTSGEVLLWQAELALARLDDPQACLALVKQALEQELNEADQAYAAGLTATNCDASLANFRTALEKDSFHHRAHRMHAYLLVILGRTEEARQRLAVAKTIFPNDLNLRIIELLADTTEGDEAASDEMRALSGQFPAPQQELLLAITTLLGQFRPAELQQTANDPFKYLDTFLMTMRPVVEDLVLAVSKVRVDGAASRMAALPPVVSRNLGTLVDVLRLQTPNQMPTADEIRYLNTESAHMLEAVANDFPEGTVHHARGLILYMLAMEVNADSTAKAVPEDAFDAEAILIRASQIPALAQIHLNSLRVAIQLEVLFNTTNVTFDSDAAKAKVEGTRDRLRINVRRLMLEGNIRLNHAAQIADWLRIIGEIDLARFTISEILRRDPLYAPALTHKLTLEQQQGNLHLALITLDKLIELTPDTEKNSDLLASRLEQRRDLVGKMQESADALQETTAGKVDESDVPAR